METAHKRVLKSISLDLRHLLEGSYDGAGHWCPGDLEQRLAAIGVRRDRESVTVDELPHLSPADCKARQVIDAYLELRADAGVGRAEAVAEFVRETAYTWANRLLALRCMEVRELIDEVIFQKPTYGGRSLEHHRLAQRQPELCAGEDDGLLAVLDKVFAEQAGRQPMLFDPEAPGVALKPSAATIKRCMALLSDSQKVGDQVVATSDVFKAPDALGWAYQYWNTEEKDRVFTMVHTQKGAKIEGADIIPATQLYTESYMVKFLVQNSLGAIWMGMHPESKLCEKWEYYVRDADRAPVEKKPVAKITLFDPAGGSGHFLLEGFDLFYDMYVEEGQITEPEDICRSILEKNLYGIDIDARAVQIAEVALWMKAAERAFGFEGKPTNLVAAVASHLKGPLWEEFLGTFPNEPSIARVLRKFGQAMEHIDELGSLARPDEDLRAIIHEEHAAWEQQLTQKKEANLLFAEMVEDKLSGHLPFHEDSDEQFGERMLQRAREEIRTFTDKARQAGTLQGQFLGYEATTGLKLLDMLSRKYDVVTANPPYMGSKNMGATLNQHVTQFYSAGKRDLYSAFMLRSLELAALKGRIGMVTQHTWMFLRSFADLRAVQEGLLKNEETSGFKGFLRESTVEVLAHLGEHAFDDAAAGGAFVVLFIVAHNPPPAEHCISGFRLVALREPSEKSALLHSSKRASLPAYRPKQSAFLAIPFSPIPYYLSDSLLAAMNADTHLSDFADTIEGLNTTDNSRFLRCSWEVVGLQEWRPYSKGGGYRKWFGNEALTVRWTPEGRKLRTFIEEKYHAHWSKRVSGVAYYDRQGWVYSLLARGSIGCRQKPAETIFDVRSGGVFPKPGNDAIIAIATSRVASYLLRSLVSALDFHAGYVARMPVPRLPNEGCNEVLHFCVRAKQALNSREVIGRLLRPFREYDSHPVAKAIWERVRKTMREHLLVGDSRGQPCLPIAKAKGIPASDSGSSARSVLEHTPVSSRYRARPDCSARGVQVMVT